MYLILLLHLLQPFRSLWVSHQKSFPAVVCIFICLEEGQCLNTHHLLLKERMSEETDVNYCWGFSMRIQGSGYYSGH